MGSHGETSVELDELIGRMVLRLQDAVAMAMWRARQKLLQGTVGLCAASLLLWTAAFLYGSFYFSFMPRAVHTAPCTTTTDCDSTVSADCSFPMANISLLRRGKNQVMTFGQPYRISLQMEMPDSPANRQLGMFIVRMTCYSKEGRATVSSSRSAMLRYQSGLLRTLRTLLLLPAFLTGVLEQKQLVEVELFSDYTDNTNVQSVGAVIEILSNKVQIYSAQLYVHAHFTGIKYLLFNFPLMSALVGVASNFVFLSILILFSYQRLLLAEAHTPRRSGGLTSEDIGQQECYEDGTAEMDSPGGHTAAVGSTPRPIRNHKCKPGSRTSFPSNSSQEGKEEL